MSEQKIKLDEEGFVLESGEYTVYSYDENGLYTGPIVEFISEGCLSSEGTTIAPPPFKQRDGYAIIFIDEQWNEVEDHVGQKYTNPYDGSSTTIKEYGPVPANLIEYCERPSYSIWNREKQEWEYNEREKVLAIRGLREILIERVVSKMEKFSHDLLAEFPAVETMSFETQANEARRYLSGNYSDDEITLINTISKEENIPLDELAKKIIRKNMELRKKTAILISKKRAMVKKVEAANTPEELDTLRDEIDDWEIYPEELNRGY